jgi:CheY-like chemotaxis protein
MTEKPTILIADDEPIIRLLISGLLGGDYNILEASDGEEALYIARHQRPDLILMDVMMPKIDGYTACAASKSDHLTKTIPVIMLSGVDHELNKKLAREIGADGYIIKPFTLQELRDIARDLLPNSEHKVKSHPFYKGPIAIGLTSLPATLTHRVT